MKGIFGKMLDGISPLIDFQISIPKNKYTICPNCANKIRIEDQSEFCNICGYIMQEYKKKSKSQEELD
jgi:rRNA maturation endonuclease Nob1